MSFQNYDSFQGQPGQQDPGAGAPPQQDTGMGGTMPDPTGQQYPGGNGGDPGSAGGQPGPDNKTTLW